MSALDIRTETPADHANIRRLVADAFGSDAEADLVERIRASPEYVPDLALVAVRDGAVVGHVMVSGATLRTREGERAILMLSPLAVDPAVQATGIGSALVRAEIDRLTERGDGFVVLEGAPAYYARFGFVAAANYSIELPLPEWAPIEAAQILPLPAFDLTALRGGGSVVYPAAFDDLD